MKKAVSRINFDGRGGHGSYGSRGGLNRSSWIINSQYEQRGEYHYSNYESIYIYLFTTIFCIHSILNCIHEFQMYEVFF